MAGGGKCRVFRVDPLEIKKTQQELDLEQLDDLPL